MASYSCRSREELRVEFKKLMARYEDLNKENLNLDMSRGKPSKLQLDLVSDILTRPFRLDRFRTASGNSRYSMVTASSQPRITWRIRLEADTGSREKSFRFDIANPLFFVRQFYKCCKQQAGPQKQADDPRLRADHRHGNKHKRHIDGHAHIVRKGQRHKIQDQQNKG